MTKTSTPTSRKKQKKLKPTKEEKAKKSKAKAKDPEQRIAETKAKKIAKPERTTTGCKKRKDGGRAKKEKRAAQSPKLPESVPEANAAPKKQKKKQQPQQQQPDQHAGSSPGPWENGGEQQQRQTPVAAAGSPPLGWKRMVGPCNVCGAMGHLGRTCPTRTCRECGEMGHLAKHCPRRHGCGHCGSHLHAARECTFGSRPGETFLFCDHRAADTQSPGRLECFSRRFILPLRQARADFDTRSLRDGRMDVACSCLSAALFRSQSLRGNSAMTLCYKGGERPQLLEVRGSVIRGLQPDDFSVACRLRQAASRPMGEEDGLDPRSGEVVDACKYSQSLNRGFHLSDGTTEDALRQALAEDAKHNCGLTPAILLLDAQGEHIDQICPQLLAYGKEQDKAQPRGRARGIVVVLGDDRGLLPEDECMIAQVAQEFSTRIFRVSLGPVVLFASHSIVLLHHYLDKLCHPCRLRTPRDLLARKKGMMGGLSYGKRS